MYVFYISDLKHLAVSTSCNFWNDFGLDFLSSSFFNPVSVTHVTCFHIPYIHQFQKKSQRSKEECFNFLILEILILFQINNSEKSWQYRIELYPWKLVFQVRSYGFKWSVNDLIFYSNEIFRLKRLSSLDARDLVIRATSMITKKKHYAYPVLRNVLRSLQTSNVFSRDNDELFIPAAAVVDALQWVAHLQQTFINEDWWLAAAVSTINDYDDDDDDDGIYSVLWATTNMSFSTPFVCFHYFSSNRFQ